MKDEQMELNIVRKVVWSYARSTGLDFDELCSEAYLAYLEAAPFYIYYTNYLKIICSGILSSSFSASSGSFLAFV